MTRETRTVASEPTVYTPQPMTTTTKTAPPAPRRPSSQPIAASSSSSSSSPHAPARGWRTCAVWLARTHAWVSRRRYELAPIAATTTVTGLGLAQDGIATVLAYGALAAGAGAGAVLGLRHKNPVVTHVGAGGAVALADVTTAVAAGFSWPTLTAWALTTGAAYGVYGPWLVQQRNARLKLNVDAVKAKGAVPAALGLEAPDPGLVGASPEETALRRAIHALTGVTPLDIPAFTHTENGGFTALVVMPAGKNTSPDTVIKRRAQLAANLGLPGTLHLAKGGADNQFVVRLTTTDALADTITYGDDPGQSIADPIRIGLDEHGEPVEITLLYRHALIAGASDWGKSGLTNLVIKRLVRRPDVDLYGIDMKPGAVELGPWAPLMRGLATTPEEARALLEWVRAECDRRGDHLAELQAQALSQGMEPPRKWVPGLHGNAIVVVTDELAELVRQDKELAELYESLLAIARSNAIQFLSATQQPSRKVFGGSTDARGNYAIRISTRMGEPGHSQFIFGQGCQSRGWRPELLDLPGKFLIAAPGRETPVVCRAEYVTDGDIAADVSHLHTRKTVVPAARPAVPAREVLRYPDGQPVDAWPDLYRAFARMGSATKKELARECGISRDTAMRAIETWQQHGVASRRDGRATRFYLPEGTDNV